MDYIFIDTNIIKKEQYFKPGNKIQTLKSLALKNSNARSFGRKLPQDDNLLLSF